MNDWKRKKLIKFILKNYHSTEIIYASKHDKLKDKKNNQVITTIPRHSKIKAPTAHEILGAIKRYYYDN